MPTSWDARTYSWEQGLYKIIFNTGRFTSDFEDTGRPSVATRGEDRLFILAHELGHVYHSLTDEWGKGEEEGYFVAQLIAYETVVGKWRASPPPDFQEQIALGRQSMLSEIEEASSLSSETRTRLQEWLYEITEVKRGGSCACGQFPKNR